MSLGSWGQRTYAILTLSELTLRFDFYPRDTEDDRCVPFGFWHKAECPWELGALAASDPGVHRPSGEEGKDVL